MATQTKVRLGPQPGPQTMFLSSPADIALTGGAAFGGKSYGLLLDPLRHYNNRKFGAVIFRRETPSIRNQGALWDTSMEMYSQVNGHPRQIELEWQFPSGMRVKFSHLEYNKTVHQWQGSQVPMFGFDELTEFTQYQFDYLASRLRSGSGVPGYIRATCNPKRKSFVRTLVDWWIKGNDYPPEERGFPIPERSGKLRWYARDKYTDKLVWGNSKKEVWDKFSSNKVLTLSFTFIPSNIDDNKIGNKKDPDYRAKLENMPRVERMQLLEGNWDVEPMAGDMFDRNRFEIIEALPAGWVSCCRFWDKAGTKPREGRTSPDWTRGAKMYRYPNGLYVIAHMASLQDEPGEVNEFIKTIATQDGYSVKIKEQQDPGQAGKEEAQTFTRMLGGFSVTTQPFSKNKVLRAAPLRAQVFARNVKMLRGDWNEECLDELNSWTGDKNEQDDQIDALSGAFNELAGVPVLGKDEVARMGRLMGG